MGSSAADSFSNEAKASGKLDVLEPFPIFSSSAAIAAARPAARLENIPFKVCPIL